MLSELDAIAAPNAAAASNGNPSPGRAAETAPAETPESARPTLDRWQRLIRFFAPGLITAAAIGVAGGVLGTFVLLRREALLALALPQVVAAGAAVGMRLGWPTLPPALVAASAALAYLVAARRRHGAGRGSGSAVPALYVAGLSLSFLVISGSGAHVEELQNLFTGIDVAVTPAQAAVAAPLLCATALLCAALWRRWLLLAQAPAAAELAGLSPARWDALFLALLTAVLLLGTDAQGVVLVLAMLFLPAAAVLPWAKRIPAALAASAALSLVLLAAGFVLSVQYSLPLSQSIGGVGFAVMLLSHAASHLFP